MGLTCADMQELLIGSESFPFRAHPASLQDIVRIPSNSHQPAQELGQVTQRVHVQVWIFSQYQLFIMQHIFFDLNYGSLDILSRSTHLPKR